MVKEWFKKASRSSRRPMGARDKGHSIDELIVLERYDEAEARLKERLRGREDVHARLKLAEVLTNLRRSAEAVDEYLRVSEQYSRDGFQDKAAAVLRKATKLDPANEGLRQRLTGIDRAKELEHTRRIAVEALKAASEAQGGRFATAAIELEQTWDRLAETDFFENLAAEQMRRLLANTAFLRVQTDSRVAVRGELRPELYLISGGEVQATLPSPNGPVTLRTFGTGQLLGDAALLEHKPWCADYTATKPSSVLKLTREGLEAALLGNPNPRALLDGLRRQRNDQAIAEAVEKLNQGG